MEQNSLMHYGVLGMKWGIRKNPEKAFSKAQKKMRKLDARQEKRQKKAVRKQYSRFTSEKKAQKLRVKADKSTYKAALWYDKVKKVFGEAKASELTNAKGVEMGQRYTDWLVYGRR